MLSKIYMLLAVVFTVMPFVQLLAGGFNSKAVALYWLLFAGYHVFVLLAVGNEDYFNYSTFGGAGFLFEDTKLLVLVYLSLFLIFFNIKIPKFTPVSCGLFLPLSSIIILFICIPAYFEYYNFLANSVKNGGYYNLYLHSNGNYLINFLSKYLPIILCILFFATNSSKSLHIVFLFPMLISHLPVLLTGQRTAFVLMMFLWGVVYLDCFVKNRRDLFMSFFSLGILILIIGFVGLKLRGGQLNDVSSILIGFSKPVLQLILSISAISADFNLSLGFIELFPGYSYFCDYGGIIASRDVCKSVDRLYYPSMIEDIFSFYDDTIMYVAGGTSGSGFVATLSRLNFVGFEGVAPRLVAFVIAVWGWSIILSNVFLLLSISVHNLYLRTILRVCYLHGVWMLLFSIAGTMSSFVMGARLMIYSVIVMFFLFIMNGVFYFMKNGNQNEFKNHSA